MPSTTPHERALAAAHLIPSLPLADLDRHDAQQLGSFHTVASYAEARLDLEPRRTRELIRVGNKLLELPAIDRAFLEDRLGWSKVLLLVQVAVPEHDEAWRDAAIGLSCRRLGIEVQRSRPGGPPREPGDRKGLSTKRFRVNARVGALTYKKIEAAKSKLAAERGGPLSEADFLDALAELALRMESDGTIPGYKRVKGSLYRIVLRPAEDDLLVETNDMGELPVDGDADDALPKRAASACIHCDAEVVTIDDARPAQDRPTPDWLRTKVLTRDGYRCRCCGSRQEVHAHHILFRKKGGRTKIRNLITLCERCHGLVHEDLLFLKGERARDVVFVDREGRPLHEAGAHAAPPIIFALEHENAPPEPAIASDAASIQVRLEDIPAAVDATWWRLHAELIRFRGGTTLQFREGRPSQAAEAPPCPSGRRVPRECAFQGLVGQDALLDRLAMVAEGTRARGLPFPHTLLQGPAGTGKTTLAKGLAALLDRTLVRTSGPLLKDVHTLIRLLADLSAHDVLFVDEIHAVPQPVLEALYEAMAERQISLTFECGSRSRTARFELPPFTVLAATTEGGTLHDALRGRFGLLESLGFYRPEDLATLVKGKAESQGITLLTGAADRLAARSRGTPREALRLLERVLDHAVTSQRTFAATQHVEEVLRKLGYDALGLAPDEQRYLRLLRESPAPIPLARLARLLGQTADGVARQIEPSSLRMGLVETTMRGRAPLPKAQVLAI